MTHLLANLFDRTVRQIYRQTSPLKAKRAPFLQMLLTCNSPSFPVLAPDLSFLIPSSKGSLHMIPLQITLLQTSRLQAPYTPWKKIMISIREILEHPVLEGCSEFIVLFHERHDSHKGNAIVIVEDVDPGVLMLVQ